MKFDIRVKNIKNIQANFKICSHVNFFTGSYNHYK